MDLFHTFIIEFWTYCAIINKQFTGCKITEIFKMREIYSLEKNSELNVIY